MKFPDHRRKSSSNSAFAQWVQEERGESSDWSATAYFYSALHLMDCFLHKQGIQCGTHKKRDLALGSLVAQGILPEDQFSQYQNLNTLSRTARYDQVEVTRDELDDIVKEDYLPLITWLKARLGI